MFQGLKLAQVFDQDINRPIESVVHVEAQDNTKLAAEIDEYVATRSIRDAFVELISNYLHQQAVPDQKIGVWVSGFFGSGKSSFAKILGYALENRNLGRETVRTRLLRRFAGDTKIQQLFAQLDTLEQDRPAQAIVFDLSRTTGNYERISEIMYRQLLEHFGYPATFELAEVELQLEREGRFEAFCELYQARHKKSWKEEKYSPLVLNRLSAALHDLEPSTYSSPDTWAKSASAAPVRLDPDLLTNRAVEIAQRRGGGCNLVFVIDEVGQFAARDIQRMLDLQGVVHAFDVGSSERVPDYRLAGIKPHSYRSRLWLVVTSQERLESVVENLDSQRTELGRLMDRFQLPVDLKPTDITEVTKQRLLRKKPNLEPAFRKLFQDHSGSLRLHTKLDAGYQRELDEQNFTDLYPLLPYQFDLIIDVITTIRSQGHAGVTYGAAVRPVLSMAHQMLRSEELDLVNQKVGRLVTFDQVYDILDHRIPAERRDSVSFIEDQHGGKAAMETKVAKALVLLSMAKGVQRTSRSISAVLYPEVGSPSIEPKVQRALQNLIDMERIRFHEGQYEFLSQAERDWESLRNGFRPTASKIREEVRKALSSLLSAQTYSHAGLRTFKPTLVLDGTVPTGVSRGDLEMRLRTNNPDPLEAFTESQKHNHAVCGSLDISAEVERAANEMLRSQEMIGRFKADPTRTVQITRERTRESQYQNELETKLAKTLLDARYYFKGQELSISGNSVNRIIPELFAEVVPKVYDKLEQLKIEVRDADLKALFSLPDLTSMNGLLGPSGLNVLRKGQGGALGLDANASIFSDVRRLVEQRYSTGQTPSGQALEQFFGDIPYGWSTDRLRYLVATLFRAGALEVHAQAQRFTSWSDPGVSEAFTNLIKFRQAQFMPREGLTPERLTEAVAKYSKLTGNWIDNLDEAVIASKLRKEVVELAGQARSVVNRLESHRLPGIERLQPMAEALEQIRDSASSEDVIKLFLGSAQLILENHGRIGEIAKKLNGGTLNTVNFARSALERFYPALPNPTEATQQVAQALEALLQSENFYDRLPDFARHTETLEQAIRATYLEPWNLRYALYHRATEDLRASADFAQLDEDTQDNLTAELERYKGGRDLPEPVWRNLNPTLEHLQADIDAVASRLDGIIRRIREQLKTSQVAYLPVSKRLNLVLEPEDKEAAIKALDERLESLRQEIMEALDTGKRVVLE